MEHNHPLPDAKDLCPFCASSPGTCCRVLRDIQEKRRKKDRERYARHKESRRAKARRWWNNRPTKPTPPGH